MSGGAKKLLHAAAGTAASGDPVYVEDVFATHLYTGNNANNHEINNGVDLSEDGGLVWFKKRSSTGDHWLVDSERGGTLALRSNDSAANYSQTGAYSFIQSFDDNGFTMGDQGDINNSSDFVAWTFKEQPGFFDVVKWTGTGANLTVSHDLGCVPGMILIKNTGGVHQWNVYHVGTDASNPETKHLVLNDTDAAANANLSKFQRTAPTATNFYVGSNADCNEDGETMIAYLFAGTGDSASQIFGDDDEAIIKCVGWTGNGSTQDIDLGFEPQWSMIKNATDAGYNWYMLDSMRGAGAIASSASYLSADLSDSESSGTASMWQTRSNGVHLTNDASWNKSGSRYVGIFIRRGPMKEPSAGTEVYKALAYTGNGNNDDKKDAGFPIDLIFNKSRDSNGQEAWVTRLLGTTKSLTPSSGADEQSGVYTALGQTDWQTGNGSVRWMNTNTYTYISWMFKRAPGFMDIAVNTGTGSATQVAHNLTVIPELIITKRTDATEDWFTIAQNGGSASSWSVFYAGIQSTAARNEAAADYSSTITATQFNMAVVCANVNGGKYASYLFATVAGVSKVGSVVHSGTTDVNCGFSAGARFVLVKRTDATGAWYIWDSTRGIVSGNDPYLQADISSGQETTNTDLIDPLASGFTLTSSFTAGTYLFLAIA